MNNIEIPKDLIIDCQRLCENKYIPDGLYYPKFLYKQFFVLGNSGVDNNRAINKIKININ